jgi:hypothetical protein
MWADAWWDKSNRTVEHSRSLVDLIDRGFRKNEAQVTRLWKTTRVVHLAFLVITPPSL